MHQNTLDIITHLQTAICRELLFAGHMMSSWPMKRKENALIDINNIVIFTGILFFLHGCF